MASGEAPRWTAEVRFAPGRGPLSPRSRLVAGMLATSTAPILVRAMVLPETAVAVWRLLLGGLVLAIGLGLTQRRLPVTRALRWLMVAGAWFALDLWCWHRAIRLVGPGVATVLVNLQVLPLALVGWWRWGERPPVTFWPALPLAGLGLILLTGQVGARPAAPEGVMLAVAAAVAFAGYLASLRLAGEADAGSDPMGRVAVASLAAGGLLVPVLAVEGGAVLPTTGLEAARVVSYALLPQAVGQVLIAGALPRIPAALAGVTMMLQPLLAMAWEVVLFGRVFGPDELLGAGLLSVAVWLGQGRATPAARPPAPRPA